MMLFCVLTRANTCPPRGLLQKWPSASVSRPSARTSQGNRALEQERAEIRAHDTHDDSGSQGKACVKAVFPPDESDCHELGFGLHRAWPHEPARHPKRFAHGRLHWQLSIIYSRIRSRSRSRSLSLSPSFNSRESPSGETRFKVLRAPPSSLINHPGFRVSNSSSAGLAAEAPDRLREQL